MSIDERVRTGLAANTEHLVPNLDLVLSRTMRRAHRRRQLRAAGAATLVAAVLAVAAWLADVPGVDRSGPPDPSKTPKVTLTEPKNMAGVDGPLEPGTWVMPMWGMDSDKLPRAVVDVPEGFGSPGGWVVDLGADGDPESYGNLAFHTVDYVMPDPCDARTYDDVGPTVQDLADALVAQPGHRTSKPQPVTVAGYKGLYLRVTLPKDTRLVACGGSKHTLWRTNPDIFYSQDIAGIVDHLWILDVQGTRVVMAAQLYPQQSKADNDKILAIAQSARFLPPLKP